MNFHQMSNQSSHMSSKLPGRQPNTTVAQVSAEVEFVNAKPIWFSKILIQSVLPMQNSSVMQQHIQLDAEKEAVIQNKTKSH